MMVVLVHPIQVDQVHQIQVDQIHPTEVELVIVQIAVETQVIQVGQVNNPPLWQPIYMVKSYHLPVPMILS